MNTNSLFNEAAAAIGPERRATYGDPKKNYADTAALWSVILGRKITPREVLLCMVAFKVSREKNCHKHDNLVDICGYAAILEELEEADMPDSDL